MPNPSTTTKRKSSSHPKVSNPPAKKTRTQVSKPQSSRARTSATRETRNKKTSSTQNNTVATTTNLPKTTGSPATNKEKKKIPFKPNPLGFVPKKKTADFLPSDERFSIITKLHAQMKGSPLKPPSTEDFQAISSLENEVKNLIDAISSSKDAVENLKMGMKLKEFQGKIDFMKGKIKQTNHHIKVIQGARKDASMAMSFWKNSDGFKFAEWHNIVIAADALLEESEPEKQIGTTQIQGAIDVDADSDSAGNDGNDTRERNDGDDDVSIIMIDTVQGDEKNLDEIFPSQSKSRDARKLKTMAKTLGQRVRGSAENATHISFRQFTKVVNTKKLHQEGFKWINGRIWCEYCLNWPKRTKDLVQHSNSGRHKKSKKIAIEREEKSQQNLAELKSKLSDIQSGKTLSDEVKQFRAESLKAIAQANISLSQFEQLKPFIEGYAKPGLSLGGVTDLPRMYLPAMRDEHINQIRKILSMVFPEYGLIFDGTPSFAEAECIMVRVVTKKFQILDLVVKVSLFDGKLTSDHVANHLLETIRQRLGTHERYWQASMQDRAGTNTAALRKTKEMVKDANPLEAYCVTHGLNNAAKKLRESAPYADNFRKFWQSVVQYAGKAREYSAELFGEKVKLSSGVRFFVQFEQIMQLSKIGIKEVVMEKIIPRCLENKWSDGSAKSLFAAFGGQEKMAELGMAILESAAVADTGITPCKVAYSGEGDSPLILVADEMFSRVESQIGQGQRMENVERVVDEALQLILAAKAWQEEPKTKATNDLATADERLDEENCKLNELLAKKDGITSGPSSRGGRRRALSSRAIDSDELDRINIQISDSKASVREAKRERDSARKIFDETEKVYLEWCQKFEYRTRASLLDHAKSIAQPLNQYYTKLFLDDDGDYYNIREGVKGCKIFDPLFLKGKQDSLPRLYLLADKLKHFGYSQFTDEFIERLKKEIKDAIKCCDEEIDWDLYGNGDQYQTRLKMRKIRYQLEDDHEMDWKRDPGEKASRIWEFWRARFFDSTKFNHYKKALRLVVLTQLSSCAVERVFSRLTTIREQCGDSSFEDMTEYRVFMLCNGPLDSLINDLEESM